MSSKTPEIWQTILYDDMLPLVDRQMNDLEWLFHDKMRFCPALLESERLNVRNSITSAILRCSVHFMIYMYLYLYSYRRETARQLRMYAQLTRCFSAVAELLVLNYILYFLTSLPDLFSHSYKCPCSDLPFWS